MAKESGAVGWWRDDARFFINAAPGWDPQLCPWCAVWPGEEGDQGTLCAHHVYAPEMMRWWAARRGG
jgi:hypothetical protein